MDKAIDPEDLPPCRNDDPKPEPKPAQKKAASKTKGT